MIDNEQKAKSAAEKYLVEKRLVGAGTYGVLCSTPGKNHLHELMDDFAKSQNEKLVKENQELREAAESALYVAKRYDRGKYGHIIDNVEQALKK